MAAFKQRKNKYNAVKTFGRCSDGSQRKFDSKFEAAVADELYMRLQAGEIKDYECQFMVEMIPYTSTGEAIPKLKVKHKVDFRVHENDGSYTLTEVKGMETTDWRRRRDWLLNLWIPDNLDHEYVVLKQNNNWRKHFV